MSMLDNPAPLLLLASPLLHGLVSDCGCSTRSCVNKL